MASPFRFTVLICFFLTFINGKSLKSGTIHQERFLVKDDNIIQEQTQLPFDQQAFSITLTERIDGGQQQQPEPDGTAVIIVGLVILVIVFLIKISLSLNARNMRTRLPQAEKTLAHAVFAIETSQNQKNMERLNLMLKISRMQKRGQLNYTKPQDDKSNEEPLVKSLQSFELSPTNEQHDMISNNNNFHTSMNNIQEIVMRENNLDHHAGRDIKYANKETKMVHHTEATPIIDQRIANVQLAEKEKKNNDKGKSPKLFRTLSNVNIQDVSDKSINKFIENETSRHKQQFIFPKEPGNITPQSRPNIYQRSHSEQKTRVQVGDEEISVYESEKDGSVMNSYKEEKKDMTLINQWINQYWHDHQLEDPEISTQGMDHKIHRLFETLLVEGEHDEKGFVSSIHLPKHLVVLQEQIDAIMMKIKPGICSIFSQKYTKEMIIDYLEDIKLSKSMHTPDQNSDCSLHRYGNKFENGKKEDKEAAAPVQAIMKPTNLHEAATQFLNKFPMNGTFDAIGPNDQTMHQPPNVSSEGGILANPFALSFSPQGSARKIEKEEKIGKDKTARQVELKALKETGVRGSLKYIKTAIKDLPKPQKHFGRPGTTTDAERADARAHEPSRPTQQQRRALLRENDAQHQQTLQQIDSRAYFKNDMSNFKRLPSLTGKQQLPLRERRHTALFALGPSYHQLDPTLKLAQVSWQKMARKTQDDRDIKNRKIQDLQISRDLQFDKFDSLKLDEDIRKTAMMNRGKASPTAPKNKALAPLEEKAFLTPRGQEVPTLLKKQNIMHM